eukprot:TRINITY_DN3604_c0_g1_i1.p2 TRINITY_DN3604_c0_g1~~TRINITY_DN3604_c0_g1_i1.p2  ORF type:complete len:208 (-),score=50.74 TRINITY_DN3604_c0_g1_i1:56-679(-)
MATSCVSLAPAVACCLRLLRKATPQERRRNSKGEYECFALPGGAEQQFEEVRAGRWLTSHPASACALAVEPTINTKLVSAEVMDMFNDTLSFDEGRSVTINTTMIPALVRRQREQAEKHREQFTIFQDTGSCGDGVAAPVAPQQSRPPNDENATVSTPAPPFRRRPGLALQQRSPTPPLVDMADVDEDEDEDVCVNLTGNVGRIPGS